MSSPLVSIIVPVYKVEQYLEECVESILAQTYKNIEVILVDDGSPDRCPRMCDSFAERDARIKVIHKKNGGLSDARNTGLDAAKGYYINFCDSDDIISPDMVTTLVELQQNYNSDVTECESVIFDGVKEEIILHYHVDEKITQFSIRDFFSGLIQVKCDCSVCNKLFVHERIAEFRFLVGKTNEDILYLFECMGACNGVTHINNGFYKYRVNPNSITHVFNERSLDAFYNSFQIKDFVKIKYPELIHDADNRIIRMSWKYLATMHGMKERSVPPYNDVYNKSKSILKTNLLKILFSKEYKLISKLLLIYRIIT